LGGAIATFVGFGGMPSGGCLADAELVGLIVPYQAFCPPATSGFSSSDLLAGPMPAGGAKVTDLYAETNATLRGSDSVTVAVIDSTTGATLLSCTVNSTTRSSCSNATGSGSAAAGDNIEVKITATGASGNNAPWRVAFRY
jgi:hypothetical protein